MADVDFLGSGFRFPFSLTEGALELSEGEVSIRESILLILRTRAGERVMRPDFGCGLSELIFAENNSTTASLMQTTVEEALLEFEPRIDVEEVRVRPDPLEENRLNIEIDYVIRSANRRTNLVYPFYLENT